MQPASRIGFLNLKAKANARYLLNTQILGERFLRPALKVLARLRMLIGVEQGPLIPMV